MSEKRLRALRRRLAEEKLDAFLVASSPNRAYLSGFTGTSGVLVLTATESLLLTDFRYLEQAKAQAPLFTVVQVGHDSMAALAETVARLAPERTGFESRSVSVSILRQWEERFGERTTLVPTEGLLEELRLVKDEEEVALLRQAARLADAGFEFLLDFLRPGRTEREVSLELEFFLRRQGADGAGFDFIVASGPRGALPHGVASGRTINRGELVTVDWGCFVGGYTSDITRTVAVGEPPERWREIYEVVRRAQEVGVAAVRPGRTGAEVDSEARAVIAQAGFGEAFGHGLGHGVGREVHEEPRLRETATTVLRPGMVVTVEPGIYLPREGGVRIEDMVLVTEDGGERLTSARRDLVIL
ncbi:MAG: Xaa-Pro peptidase family protein [Bacillota bacterium]|nr:Xaa-Pro peptidase family protein [Bacillota bacterium]